MTSQTNKLLKNKSKTIYICAYRELKLPIIAFILTTIILYFSDEAKSGAYNGLMLCINCVIPSLFPFMVLSDLVLWVIDVDVGTVGRMFEGLLGIRKRGTTAYISGAICGYPVGISNTVSLRKNSLISKEEADILAPLSANPSLTFVTVGIGGGIFKSIVIGIFLYITSILSGIITAFIFKRKSTLTYSNNIKSKELLDFSAFIIDSGRKTLIICSFVIFFSSLGEVLKSIINSPKISGIILALLEISSGISELCRDNIFGKTNISFMICAAALSFGGVSVLLQAMSIGKGSDLSIIKFFKFKVVQSVISVLLSAFFLCFRNFFY